MPVYNHKCDKCNYEFKFTLGVNSWCPLCINDTEQKLYQILLPLYSTIEFQFKQDWCKNIESNRHLPFDFCISENKIIIELDGPQHFRQIMEWKTPEEQQKQDLYKEKCANDNGYSTIRLLQEDVANDTNNWLLKFQNAIQYIIDDPDVIHNIYICRNNEYDNYL
jgi:very-short-patch-repair endonuclease